MSRNLVVAAVAALALAFAVFTIDSYFGRAGAAVGAAGGPGTLAGAPAASYDVPTLAGGTDGLAEHRGSVVLINLWASWCGPCRAETPALERLYRAERARGLVVLGVDQGESARAAGDFARSLGLTYPILLDADQQYGRTYASVGLPTSVVVDRRGRVVRGIDGELDYAQMVAAVEPALAAR